MLFALGLGDSVVAVTHECDHPAQAATLPHVTRSVIPDGLTAAEIDREVRKRTGRGEAIYELDSELLHELEPDLIVAQQVCEVCAVSYEDVLGFAGERSRTAGWDELEAARPEIVVSMPCGYDAERAAVETRLYADRLARLGADRVVAVDASAYFSRPGPRLVDGVELLAHLLHPDLVDAPAGRAVELVG